ncbi:unnamed protein product [Choristocarpus tenellus]
MANTIHVAETWFCVMADGERFRVFPHEGDSDLPGPPTVQHKSRISKTMIIATNAHPVSAHRFDRKLGVWRVCEPKTVVRTELLPTIKTKMPWLQGKHVVIQQDGATPHTGKGSSEILSEAGKTEGWSIRLVVQPSNSSNLNIMDLCFFRSLKCQVMGKRFGSIEEMAKIIKK